VTLAKAGDDGRLQRSAEPSIVLVQGGHVGEAAGLKRGAMHSGHLVTHDGKGDAIRASNARRDTILQRDRGLERFDIGRAACLNKREVCFIAPSCAPGATVTTDQRAIHRRRGAPLR
jgi:hypothetical protein